MTLKASRHMRESGIEWVGQIPATWTTAPLYARYVVQLGKMLDARRITGEHLSPYLRNVDVQWGLINTDDLPEMDFTPDERKRFQLQSGDLVVCEGGEVGRCAIWSDKLDECYYQKAIHRLRPKSQDDWPPFFFHVMRAAAYSGTFVAGGNPNTIDHLTAEKLRVHRFAFPPLPEQRAITAFLDRKTAQIDSLIAKKQRLIELLQEKRQALISHAVTKGLDPHVRMKDSGVEWLGEVPAHWMTRRFRHCGTIPNGQVDPRLPEYRDMVLIAPNHIESVTGRLIQTETAYEQGAESGKYVAQKCDVIYSKIRPELQKACIAQERCLCSADMYPITPKPDMVAEYILYNLLCDWFTKYAVLWSDRVAMPKVNRETLGNCFMVIPPIAEQHQIVRYIKEHTEHIDKMTDRIRTQVTKLQEYRQTLISAVVTGKIDVTKEAHP